jgi:hypothetical protein
MFVRILSFLITISANTRETLMEPIGSFFSSFSIRSCCSAVVVCEVERCFERVLKLFSGVKIKISIGKQNLLKSVEVSLLNIEFLLGMN